MGRRQTRLSALRCGNKDKTPVWLPLSSALSPFPLFPRLFPRPFPLRPPFLPSGLEIAQSSFGVWHSALPSHFPTRGPLRCFMLYMSLSHPDFLLASAPVLSWHQHLGNCWQKALNQREKRAHLSVPFLQVTFPVRLSERSVSVCSRRGEAERYFCMC